jgi:hypothetical protein
MDGLEEIKSPLRSWIGKGKVSPLRKEEESCAKAPEISVIENAIERKQHINNPKQFGPNILLIDIQKNN